MTEMKNIKIGKFFKGFKELLDTNAPTIMTFGSVLGVIGTVYFMHKAAKEAAKTEIYYEENIKALDEQKITEEMTDDEVKEELRRLKVSKVINLVTIYRWALLSGIGSAGFAILSNYLNGRTIMMLGTLLATNTDKLQKVSEKAKELVGEEKFRELKESVENELLGEKITKGEVKGKKPSKKEIAKNLDKAEDGLTRFYIPFDDDFWDLPYSTLENAIAEAQRMEYLSWNDFRNMCGYGSSWVGYKFCWDEEHPFKAHIGYANCVGQFGMKCLSIDVDPVQDMCGGK